MTKSSEILVLDSDSLSWCDNIYRCTIGRGGFCEEKSEGDETTPIGRFPLRRVFYRADRINKPKTALPIRAIRTDDGWCDAPEHVDYNRMIVRPFAASHEALWRHDMLYDVIVELGYNDAPVVPNRGSAVFFHLARPDFSATEGCVAVARPDMLQILADCGPETFITIRPGSRYAANAGQK